MENEAPMGPRVPAPLRRLRVRLPQLRHLQARPSTAIWPQLLLLAGWRRATGQSGLRSESAADPVPLRLRCARGVMATPRGTSCAKKTRRFEAAAYRAWEGDIETDGVQRGAFAIACRGGDGNPPRHKGRQKKHVVLRRGALPAAESGGG